MRHDRFEELEYGQNSGIKQIGLERQCDDLLHTYANFEEIFKSKRKIISLNYTLFYDTKWI